MEEEALDIVEILKHLTEDQRQRYLLLEKTFDSDGWPLIIEWATKRANECHSRAANANSWDDNRISVGAREVYLQIANMRDSTTMEFSKMAEANLLRASEEDSYDDLRFE
jgi:hypothetical protein